MVDPLNVNNKDKVFLLHGVIKYFIFELRNNKNYYYILLLRTGEVKETHSQHLANQFSQFSRELVDLLKV